MQSFRPPTNGLSSTPLTHQFLNNDKPQAVRSPAALLALVRSLPSALSSRTDEEQQALCASLRAVMLGNFVNLFFVVEDAVFDAIVAELTNRCLLLAFSSSVRGSK